MLMTSEQRLLTLRLDACVVVGFHPRYRTKVSLWLHVLYFGGGEHCNFCRCGCSRSSVCVGVWVSGWMDRWVGGCVFVCVYVCGL